MQLGLITIHMVDNLITVEDMPGCHQEMGRKGSSLYLMILEQDPGSAGTTVMGPGAADHYRHPCGRGPIFEVLVNTET